MPINAYVGLMGSGKSYEVVASVIVPAVNKGRRVVTNVDGIDGDAIRAYCNEHWGTPLADCGEVVHCTNEDVARADFLPHGTAVDTFVRPGDLVCIDEAFRVWGTGVKLLDEHKIFFREHRHYVHPEKKTACDLVLMTQDIGDLHRTLKVVVEMTVKTTKLKSVGLHKAYKVETWESYRTSEKLRLGIMNKRYDKEIFPLYSSYSGGAGKEVQLDARQNILASPKMLAMLFAPLLFVGLAFFGLFKFFHQAPKGSAVHQSAAHAAVAPGGAAPGGAVAPGGAASATPAGSAGPRFSSTWAVAGVLRTGEATWVVLRGEGGRFRLESTSLFAFDGGQPVAGTVDGERVTRFSGPMVVQSSGGPNVSKAVLGGH